MNLVRSIACIAALLAAVVGGIGLAAAPAVAAPNNPYAGSWAGTFQAVGGDATGTVEWEISASGAIKGSFFNTVFEVGGTMTGHIDKDGTIHLNPNIYGAGPGGKGQNGEHYAGTAYIDENGDLVAPTTGTWHGAGTVVATLSPV